MKSASDSRQNRTYSVICNCIRSDLDDIKATDADDKIVSASGFHLDELLQNLPITLKTGLQHSEAKTLQKQLYEAGLEALVVPDETRETAVTIDATKNPSPVRISPALPINTIAVTVFAVLLAIVWILLISEDDQVETTASSLEDSVFSIKGRHLYGTGFLVDDLIVTAYHVIDGEILADLVLSNASFTFQQDDYHLVIADKSTDIALFRVGANAPRSASKIVNMDRIIEGDIFTLMGYPASSVTSAPSLATISPGATSSVGDVPYFELGVPLDAGYSGGPVFDREGMIVGMAVKKKAERDGVSWDVLLAAHESPPGQWRDPSQTRYGVPGTVLKAHLELAGTVNEDAAMQLERTYNAKVTGSRVIVVIAKYNSFYSGLLDRAKRATDPESEARSFGRWLELAESEFDYLKVDENMVEEVANDYLVDRELRYLIRDNWEWHKARKEAWMSGSLAAIAEFESRGQIGHSLLDRLGELLKY